MPLDDAFMIDTQEARLAAVYHAPQKDHYGLKLGCIILVGGPQYRVGAHRQYVALARGLAKRGVGVLRFDYQGMGDSTGTLQAMEDRGADIEAASNALSERLGRNAKIFPWGLCEGASAIFMHNHRIVNMAGAIIANPWVGDARIEAQVRWRHYYLGRLNLSYMKNRIQSRPLFGGNFFKNAKGFLRGVEYFDQDPYSPALTNLPDDMAYLLARNRPILYIASTDDRERETFDYALSSEPRWKQAHNKSILIRKELTGADHTFSTARAKQKVEDVTFNFIDEQTRPIGALAPAA
ncbi:MAG: hydrolase 1, exosortase A system-associated [Pseudomonadota bacterium]